MSAKQTPKQTLASARHSPRMLAAFYKALGDEQRLAILRQLAQQGEQCICDIAHSLGRDQSVAYRHIRMLEAAGLVLTRKDGPYLLCRIAPGAKKHLEEPPCLKASRRR
ncbi:hypothetical protein AUJ68_01795 [Candidatus Woesearchaeota archaeon CG1_02_57_44]|nr:MAG: hypothetical protein AUJ68_01795 [Candidatus Woesearchaeota archaeon CG1_02_57_44]